MHFFINKLRLLLRLLLLPVLVIRCSCIGLIFFRVISIVDFLLFFVAMVIDVLFVLDVQLAALQVNVVDIEVVLMELHVDHFLALLVHFIFF